MVDIAAAREAMPGKVLAGNHDPVSDLLNGTPGAIRRKTATCRQAAGPRFMVNAGCEIPSKTPLENLKALCEPLALG
ncbi:MAG: uroporphyrinogen decarboxylase family protein [Puniceicoccaceae bacterium]